MTKKHFKALAAAIADIKDFHERIGLNVKIGKVCEDVNEQFNWELWDEACKVNFT